MNPMQLHGVATCSIYACCVPGAWVRFEPYVKTNFLSFIFFDSVSGAHESKEGHL